MSRALVFMLGLAAACTKPNPDICNADSDCEARDPTKPFCDLNGEYAESGHITNTCTVIPVGCPVERCGCTAGNALSCSADQLTVCGPDGHSTVTSTCALGCATSEARCLTFDPSNGLGAALTMAATKPDLVLPVGARIDTDTGVVQSSGGTPITVDSIVVTQTGGPLIRVFMGKTFVLDDTVVVGSNSFALAAPGEITIRGRLNARARGVVAGPGELDSPATCVGMVSQEYDCSPFLGAIGAGGGGNATFGAKGGGAGLGGAPGGSANTAFVPLLGGCRGGALLNTAGTLLNNGGGGGGSVELVSLTEILLTNTGLIDVGGGGGLSSAGGGSGGTVIVEAPVVRMDGATTGITANGGGGGGCDSSGADATADGMAAPGALCGNLSAGNGGTGTRAVTAGALCTTTCICSAHYGAGGGAVGRVRIATKTGNYDFIANPTLSAVVTNGTLVPH